MAKRDRDAKGRFVKGHTAAGPGRPPVKKEYLALLRETVTPKRWQAICHRAIAQAMKGNAPARKWLSDYLLGKPVEHVMAEILTTPMTLEQWLEIAAQRRKEVENVDSDGSTRHDTKQPQLDDRSDAEEPG